ncbi:uncharacterized protein FFB20_10714 [Fusarium fujikuroi]|nr:uncharacterized protein Y057_4078 [Fusarium fujikuroi]SCN80448.1 uncharacterized protein FFC1_03555 [Fusarium fujikuroi]SCN98631.1 uncharacterized protein FFB20_10714 [Fusarium fujikuroi]SCO32657.1 uncharacterized protein FFNC_03011 [Fusarium fujikuroi]SCV51192.1 uncharacterized protein FFFS_09821 [Fusarium fujikuroi]
MGEIRSPRPKRMAPKRNTDMENYRLSEEGKLLWEAFEKVKPRMCGQAAKLTIEAMEEHREYRDRTGPSSHPFYARIKGKGQIDDPERYYYPYLLVIQTIWPESYHVQAIGKAFSRYWGVPDLWRGPENYPKIHDIDREMRLVMGREPKEAKVREDKSSSGNGEEREEEEKYVKQEDMGEEDQLQEDGQEEEEEQADGDQNEDDEDTIPDVDAITDIYELDGLENKFEKREKELMAQVHKAKELIRKVQERKRNIFKKKARASKKVEERLLKKAEERRKTSEYWANMEREYTKKLEQPAATSSAISPPPEQENQRPAKRQRVIESEE